MAAFSESNSITIPSAETMGIKIKESSPFLPLDGGSGLTLANEDEVDNEDDEKLILGATPVTEEDEEIEHQVLYQAQAVGNFKGLEKGDLSIKTGEIMHILKSSRDDGWLLAENALGERGLIPGNHVQKLKDISQVMKIYKDKASTTQPTTEEGKHLWNKLKTNIRQTNLSDVLSAFGALPSGFRESTLEKLLTETDNHLTSSFLFPRLTMSGMAFKNLKWDHDKDQLMATESLVSREFVILAAKMIPTPGKGIDVLSRHVRIALFDKNKILSNIHTVRAKWSLQDENRWTFLPKNHTLLNSLYHRYGIVKTDSTNKNIELLFELCILFKKKSGDVKEFSSGWSSLPLFDHNGFPLPNRTYELKVHGGTPFDSTCVDLDPALAIKAGGGRMPSILRRNHTPRLYVQLVNQSRELRTSSKWLPSTIVTSQKYVKAIGCFRELVGEAFLSNRKGLPLPTLVYKPALCAFMKTIDQPDIMDYTLEKWSQHVQVLKRSEKNNLKATSSCLEKTLLSNTYPLLISTKLLPSIWGNPTRQKEREVIVEKFSEFQANTTLLSADLSATPLNFTEQWFKVY